MNIKEIITIIATLLNLSLGIFIFLKNRKSQINISYWIMSMGVVGWILTNAFFQKTSSLTTALLWARLSDISAIILVSSLFYFSLVFPENIHQGGKYSKYIVYVLTSIILSFCIFFPGLVRKEVLLEDTIQKKMITNVGFYAFAAYILFFSIWLLINLRNKYRISDGIAKVQIQYVLNGLLIGTLFGATFNLILPLLGNYTLVWLGPNFTIIALLFIAYSVIKHHLFNIRVIATELLVGLVAITLLVDLLLSESITLRLFKAVVFLIFIYLGISLIQSVLKEIKRREELEKLTQQLEQANIDLKKLDQAKTGFISMASHQLRTPLSAIKGYISMLLEGSYGKLSLKAKDKLLNVFQSNERLIQIINDLLNISKAELGKMELEMSDVQIADLLQSCFEEMKFEAEKRHLKLEFEKPTELLPKIQVDELKIRQVVLNLIDNAIKYTTKGGVTLRARKENSNIQISVQDTGEGLTDEEQKAIFSGFVRGTAGINFFVEGAGLGLFVAKKFIELHGGKIWAESEGSGKGSTFVIELPIDNTNK